jgi:hypothetical protein
MGKAPRHSCDSEPLQVGMLRAAELPGGGLKLRSRTHAIPSLLKLRDGSVDGTGVDAPRARQARAR